MHLRAAKIPFEREVVLDELRPRKWRWDFVLREARLLVEVQGGIFSGGRHTRGYGYQGDIEKHNSAVLAGWRVLSFSSKDVKKGVALALIEKAVCSR